MMPRHTPCMCLLTYVHTHMYVHVYGLKYYFYYYQNYQPVSVGLHVSVGQARQVKPDSSCQPAIKPLWSLTCIRHFMLLLFLIGDQQILLFRSRAMQPRWLTS